jgi:hypothetical protein
LTVLREWVDPIQQYIYVLDDTILKSYTIVQGRGETNSKFQRPVASSEEDLSPNKDPSSSFKKVSDPLTSGKRVMVDENERQKAKRLKGEAQTSSYKQNVEGNLRRSVRNKVKINTSETPHEVNWYTKISKLILLNRHYYTIYDYLFEENEIIRELKIINPKNSLILVGPNIPPAHGLNIYLATHTEFLAHAHDIGKPFYYINTITKCGKINEDLPGFKYYLDWQCMTNVDALSWKQINLQTSITHVLIKNDKKLISLKLPVIAKSKHFILYSLKKN